MLAFYTGNCPGSLRGQW